MSDSVVDMDRNETLSAFGKNYCLKHIRLVRDFCFRAAEALAKKDLNASNFLLERAYRIVKGISPFCRYANPKDRQFFIQIRERLAKFFYPSKPDFSNISAVKNWIEEIIIETIDIEKNLLGISFAQLSQKVLVENNWQTFDYLKRRGNE
jgi:hypothetical protein